MRRLLALAIVGLRTKDQSEGQHVVLHIYG
jgi:hypothetical protein